MTDAPGIDPSATVLKALDDESCRHILETVTTEPMTAKEIADACQLPLSSTYRKLDLLAETALVEVSTRVQLHDKHVREYLACFERVVVTLDADAGLETHVADTPNGETDDERPALPTIDANEVVAVTGSERVVIVPRGKDAPWTD